MSATVCHITTIHPAKDTRIFQKECVSLAHKGYEVTLLAGNATTEQDSGVRTIGVEIPSGSRMQRFRKAARRLYEKAQEVDADVYHFHDPEFLPWAEKLAEQGKRVIYDAHEDVPRQLLAKHYIPKPFRKIVSRRFEKMENRVVGKLAHVVTATTHIRDRFLNYNPNCTDVKNYPKLAELGGVTPFKQKKREVCYVGSITRVRGIVELVKAMAGLDYRLNLGGAFSDQELRNEVVTLEGWKNVNELGFLSREEVKKVLAESRVGMVALHPIINYIDALPVKMFEYMAAGIPVVSSNIPMWQEIVNDAACGLCVDPMNPDEIREAILELLTNDEKAREMGENGRKAVEDKYNWEAEEHRLFGVYEQVLGGR